MAETSAGAIVMSLGIFLNGAVLDFPFLHRDLRILVVVLAILWVWIAVHQIKPAFAGEFHAVHTQDPLQSFAVGTWVAGTSVCDITLIKIWPRLEFVEVFFAILTVLLWLVYLPLCFRNFLVILRTGLKRKVNGIILLLAVSTQSVAIVVCSQHFLHVPKGILIALLLLGGFFYFFCLGLIVSRYSHRVSRLILMEEWANANCIMHGAMSITGLAGALSGAVSGKILFVIWLWSLVGFILVEIVEVVRAILRICHHGWLRAIGTYHVSQWSRIFTFGMFYAFTMNFNPDDIGLWRPIFTAVRIALLKYGAWVVLLLIVGQFYLLFKMKWSDSLFGQLSRKISVKAQERSH